VKNMLLAVPLLAAGVLAAGCASSSSSTTTTGTAPTVATSSTGGANAGATGAPTGAASTPAGSSGGTAASTAACTSGDLKVTIGGGPGAGMSQDHVGLQFTNVGSSACTLSGYPGVSWVAGADGHQVGAAATRQANATGTEKTVTLAPGGIASAPLDIVDAAVFSTSQCKPVPVRGLRVYPPNEKAALFLPMPTEKGGYGECSGTTPQSSLSIGYLQSGAQPTS
jgi:Protein of unknown function (DUF4232)